MSKYIFKKGGPRKGSFGTPERRSKRDERAPKIGFDARYDYYYYYQDTTTTTTTRKLLLLLLEYYY